LKRELIHKNLEVNLLPFLQQPVSENESYLIPDNQSFVIGFMGLNELVKAFTGKELHEGKRVQTLAKTILEFMNKHVTHFKQQTGLNFVLSDTTSPGIAKRFAAIDTLNYPDTVSTSEYSHSFHTTSESLSAREKFEIESRFHPLVAGGSRSTFQIDSPESIFENLKWVIRKTDIGYFNFKQEHGK